MIVERTDTQMESTMTGRKINLRVDQDNMQHIMSLLTDAYSDPEYAIIREYSTNAWDSHVEAKVTDRPIEVTMPSNLSPFLRIRDFGTGLDMQGIEEVYSQYGASTKRGTNEQNGTLGIGCKSALTYSDQFSLIAVKDGTSYTVSISMDDEGCGSMRVENVIENSDRESGVEVVIPVKRGHALEEKARAFFRAWTPGTVLVNGKQPAAFEGLPVSDNMLVIEGEYQDYVVMGNVPYPVDAGKIKHGLTSGGYRRQSYGLVTFVKIGEVNFPPSREALRYNTTTNHTLERIQAEFKANVQGSIQKQMDACPTPAEALQVMVRYHQMLPSQASTMLANGQTYTYHGKPVPPALEAERIVWTSRQSGSGRSSEFKKIGAEAWPTTLFVYGWQLSNVTATQKEKLLKYCEDNDLQTVDGFALVKDEPTIEWIEHKVDYEATIKPIKLNPALRPAGSGRIPGSYDLYDCKEGRKRYGVPANDIDQQRPVFYANGGKYSGGTYHQFIEDNYTDAYVVSMASTRVAKFCRHFPKARPVAESVTEKYNAWAKSIKPEQLEALACADSGERGALQALDPTKIDDPDVRKAIALSMVDVKALEVARGMFSRYMRYIDLSLPNWKYPLDKYPLYQYRGYNMNFEHIIIYMNAVYAASTEEV